MRAGDDPEFVRAHDAHEAGEVPHVELIGAAGFGVGDVGEPFQFRGTSARP